MGLVQLVLDLFAPAAPQAPTRSSNTVQGSEAPPTERMRQTVLAHQVVPYVLKRVRRRTIGMLVSADGLEVRAPRWVSLKEIDAALQEKADWIVRKLADSQALRQRQLAQAIDWREGATFPYLGQPVRLRLGSVAHPLGHSPVKHPHWERGAGHVGQGIGTGRHCLGAQSFRIPATGHFTPDHGADVGL